MPAALQLRVVLYLDAPSAAALGQVNRPSKAIVHFSGHFAFQQRLVLARAWYKTGQELLDVLDRAVHVVRMRQTPWIVFEPDAALLDGIAKLTQGSQQRPVALYSLARPRASWPAIPRGIDAHEELHYLRRTCSRFDEDISRLWLAWPSSNASLTHDSQAPSEHTFFERLRQLMGYLNLSRTQTSFCGADAALRWVDKMLHQAAQGHRDHDIRSALCATRLIRLSRGLGTTLRRGLPDLASQDTIFSIILATALQEASNVSQSGLSARDVHAWRLNLSRVCERHLRHAPEMLARIPHCLDIVIAEYFDLEII